MAPNIIRALFACLLLFCPTILLSKSISYQECNLAYECSGFTNDSDNSYIIESGRNARIECNGYSSCYEASALVVDGNSDSQLIECGGSFSCYNASVISAGGAYEKYSDYGEIMCEGYHSCAHSHMYSQDFINCQGSFSCLNSVITYDRLNYGKYFELTENYTLLFRNFSSLVVTCNGIRSCAGSNIITARYIYGYGLYSLEYTNIYTNGSDLNITLWGSNAGFNLHIYCGNEEDGFDDLCNLKCHGNGCNKTYLHCLLEDGESTRGVLDGYPYGNCNYQCGNGVICPYICIDETCFHDTDSPFEWNKQEYNNNELKEATQFLDMYSYDDVYCVENSTFYTSKSILCDDWLTYSICYDLNDTLTIENGSICCRGGFSCLGNDGGYKSGLDASARIKHEHNEIGKASHIICDGRESCSSQTLVNSNGNIYCSGSDACIFSDIYGNIYDDLGVYYNDITRLYCDGQGSCQSVFAWNFNKIYCNGLDSCTFSYFVGISELYGYGYYSLVNSVIVTELVYGLELNVYLESDYVATGMQIYCNNNNTCNVHCNTVNSCFNVTLICNGTCDTHCGLDRFNNNDNNNDNNKNNNSGTTLGGDTTEYTCPIVIDYSESTDVNTNNNGQNDTNTLPETSILTLPSLPPTEEDDDTRNSIEFTSTIISATEETTRNTESNDDDENETTLTLTTTTRPVVTPGIENTENTENTESSEEDFSTTNGNGTPVASDTTSIAPGTSTIGKTTISPNENSNVESTNTNSAINTMTTQQNETTSMQQEEKEGRTQTHSLFESVSISLLFFIVLSVACYTFVWQHQLRKNGRNNDANKKWQKVGNEDEHVDDNIDDIGNVGNHAAGGALHNDDDSDGATDESEDDRHVNTLVQDNSNQNLEIVNNESNNNNDNNNNTTNSAIDPDVDDGDDDDDD